MTENFISHLTLAEKQQLPYHDNESFLAYWRQHSHLTVEEFGNRVMAACEKIDQQNARRNEDHTL